MNISKLFRKKNIEEIIYDSLDTNESANSLKKTLNVRDLTAFGIAAIIGAGIFSTIGNAATTGGPAISVLFVFTAIACGFSALCYAEFASRIPVSGSAYTYAYYTFGEIIAWIIGWDLLLEYAIGNIAVAISWSDYLTEFIAGFNIHIPYYLTIDYFTAFHAHKEVMHMTSMGQDLTSLSSSMINANQAWIDAPSLGSIKLIADIPALIIIAIITYLVYIGIKESKNANNIMVGLKLVIIVGVIITGSFYVNPGNWNPFAPQGLAGILKGVSAVFFAYIGFDAISTTAEECKNPKRDLPKAIIYSLVICTILYVLIALVLTGMVKYNELGVGDPLAFVFKRVGLSWIGGIVAFTALIAMASVLLIFQIGQPRIWMSMSRDGLLPKAFSRIHPIYKTPSFATIVTGLVVAIPALFMNLTEVTDLTSIGTLFAFIIVCGGSLMIKHGNHKIAGRFEVPYLNGKYLIPAILLIAVIFISTYSPEYWRSVFLFEKYQKLSLTSIAEKLPRLIFVVVAIIIGIRSYTKNLSVIPVLGLLSCMFLMSEMGHKNWMRFLIWLVVGLVVYFTFSIKNSKLNSKKEIHNDAKLT
jgi:basic amino acid/polyamine antiporter, APA family